jgi:hypothetical protein
MRMVIGLSVSAREMAHRASRAFLVVRGRGYSPSLLHKIWLIVVTLKFVYQIVVLIEISCLFLGQDEVGS